MRRAAMLCLICLSCTPSKRTVHVFAAASLAEVFAVIEAQFERAHPDIDVAVSAAGSQTLRLQIEHGAPADLFISANPAHAQALIDQQLGKTSRRFATNTLVLAVPAANPAGIQRLADLPRARRLILGEPTVPVGRYATEALQRAGLMPSLRAASREANARLIATKIALGEADAALVYRTDVRHHTAIRVIELPWSITAEYRLVTVQASPDVARFDAFLRGPGRQIMQAAGFTD